MTTFHKFILGMTGGLVAVSVIASFVFPPEGTTQAPKAHMELLSKVNVAAAPVAKVESNELAALVPQTGIALADVSYALSYDLAAIGAGEGLVPRVSLVSIPHDLDDVQETAVRKELFFKSVLPLVLKANEEILASRARIEVLQKEKRQGKEIKAVDRLWLAMMSERYKVDRGNLDTLLKHVDIIPPSLALAQAAKESGWGLSRFTREGNALFGQWTWDTANGLVPEGRDVDKSHMIRRFENLLGSVRSYMKNLNSHRAYREMRTMRAGMRQNNKPIDGRILVGALHSYSELGAEYVNAIRSMISYNKLNHLDDARLAGDPSA